MQHMLGLGEHDTMPLLDGSDRSVKDSDVQKNFLEENKEITTARGTNEDGSKITAGIGQAQVSSSIHIE